MQAKARPWVIAAGCAAWIALSLWLYSYNYPYSPNYLPLLPLVLLGMLQAIRSFEAFLFSMVFMVPLSVNIVNVGGGFGAALPDEALLLCSAAGIAFMIVRRQLNPLPLLLHPIGIVILLQLIWSGISWLGSSHGEISAKFVVARSTYIIVYYIGFGTLFANPERVIAFFKAYLWGLIPVMIWAIFHLSQFGLSRKFSPVMAEPFYDDHTVFGACLAMVVPWAGWIALRDKIQWKPLGDRNWAWPILGLVIVALLLSFSRAAWMGLGVVGIVYLILRFRIKFRFFAFALVVVAAGAWIGREAIVERFQRNEHVSGEDVFSTAASVTNVNTDDSNKERINRWACALRMFEERPWMGWGPGTYEREYGNFQVLTEITRISTWAGDRGDAHSEYLGVLAEQGIPGLILLGGLFLMSIRVGMHLVYQRRDAHIRGLAMAILMGLSTFYFHGFVNDFFDIDKAAVLIWGMLGMLAALDLHLRNSVTGTYISQNSQKLGQV